MVVKSIGTLVLLLSLLSICYAHDHWINKGGYKNGAGELCCGERDCWVVHAHHVSLPAPGYRVFETGEWVPEGEALPSQDGQFWRCAWGGKRKCFFAPPEGY